MPAHRVPVEKRFWEKVEKRSDGCWEWVAGKNKAGYGRMIVDGVPQLAHRLSYAMRFGAIPKGLCVCHHCDNPGCVRPEHLFTGTHGDNVRDAQWKGRMPKNESSKPARSQREHTPRHHAPPDAGFDRRVREVIGSWRMDGGEGAYASRRIANTVHELQFPCRSIDKQMRDAIEEDVPLERVERLGQLLIERARELHARKRRKPAA
jgi:hypothetical protein